MGVFVWGRAHPKGQAQGIATFLNGCRGRRTHRTEYPWMDVRKRSRASWQKPQHQSCLWGTSTTHYNLLHLLLPPFLTKLVVVSSSIGTSRRWRIECFGILLSARYWGMRGLGTWVQPRSYWCQEPRGGTRGMARWKSLPSRLTNIL